MHLLVAPAVLAIRVVPASERLRLPQACCTHPRIRPKAPSLVSTACPCPATSPPASPEFRQGARTPDHPHSLYEGDAAAVCLWADLLGDPERAGFPMFEIDV